MTVSWAEENLPVPETLEDAIRERNSWCDTAAQHLRNEEYYRGLVQEVGAMLGPEVFVSDDGSVQDSILCAKVPQLVRSRLAQQPDVDWKAEALLRFGPIPAGNNENSRLIAGYHYAFIEGAKSAALVPDATQEPLRTILTHSALKACRPEIERQRDRCNSDEEVAPYQVLLDQIDAALAPGNAGPITTEQLDQLQFGRSLHERPGNAGAVEAWQPIETAPKDGTRILTWGCLHNDGGVDMGEIPDVQFSFWEESSQTFYSDEWGSHQPTHWMPLPAAPLPA
jgi:hypothetical protein